MSTTPNVKVRSGLPPEQAAIRAKCFNPAGTFVEFKKEEVEQSIPDRFEKIVRQFPERVALKTRTVSLTYGEINKAANGIAWLILNELGRKPEPVAIFSEKLDEVVVGMLGVLKAGKFYVPLDPSFPDARIQALLEDSQARLILGGRAGSRFQSHTRMLINVEGCRFLSSKNPSLGIPPESFACILYTSGSTGEPKGVIQDHRNVLHKVRTYTNEVHISPADRLSFFYSPAFAAAVHNLFGALLNGACVVLFDLRCEDIAGLGEYLIKEKITMYDSVSTLFRHFASTLKGDEEFPHLRLIRLGSEQVYQSDVELFKKLFSESCILANSMGITEAFLVRLLLLDKKIQLAGNLLPVGYEVDDKDILLLDDHGSEVGVNCVGEIAVRSRYLSPGYWSRPDLTAAAFLPDPAETGKRVYCTGDLGRMAEDGCLEHLGRKDFRAKIRGYSIQPGEVEAAILEHPGIKEAAVVVRQSRFAGDSDLVAYFVPGRGVEPGIPELRRWIAGRLPPFMIPSVFVKLRSLPLTGTGKLDRRALPQPRGERPELGTPFVAPRTSVEHELTRIWAAVMELDRVGINDSFFDLGGHSLAAAEVLSRVSDTFGVDLSLELLFQTSTVFEMAALIDRKRGLLELKLAAKRSDSRPKIPPLPRRDFVPLSFSQEALWFLYQLDPNTIHYNEPVAFRLRGVLNIESLRKAIDVIIARHDVLRTTFSAVDGVPMQVISPDRRLEMRIIDLSQVSAEMREGKIQELLNGETRRPFNLSSDLMLRVILLKLAPEEHILLLVMHHIVSDGWSMGVLYRELSVLYGAFSQGKPSPLPDLPIQYADFAVWQREWLQGEVLERQLSYWKRQLDGIPAVLNLPTDRPRPAVQSHRGTSRSIELSEELARGLKALSRKEGVTLFMTLLAAFQTLLHRYSGQDDIVVGSPIANRNRSEIEGLIGFFVNTLVLRSNFSDNPTFEELLARVREMALGAYAHQDLPFEKLVEELHPERSLSHSPLFQVMLVLQNMPSNSLECDELRAGPVRSDAETAKFDLTLFISETVEGLSGSLEYNSDLFDGATIDRVLGHFQILLEGIIGNPEQRISDLLLMTQAEQHQLIIEWNNTERDYPKDKCIHELFEAQVEKSPDAVAVVFEDQQLSYREMNARANQLAHYLRKLGVRSDVLVALCMERSLEMIVGLLGILKAGGAYVPLDPEYPNERLKFMLEDTRAPVLLTQKRLVEALPAHSAQVVCLDSDWEEIAQQSEQNPNSEAMARNLAYVIYTSGSTGQPKGVEVAHRGVLRLLFGVECIQLGVNETFLHLARTSFDASTFEIWGALLHGAKCVLFSGQIPSPNEIGNTLHQYKITTLWLTASLFNTVIDEAPEALSGVHQLLIGGEALSIPHVRRAVGLLPHTQIVNGYGPTESTTFTCCYPIPARLDETISPIAIGRPIANTEVYLLDSHLSPVPIGVTGELYIGGDGLARGYLNRPELTAEKFIANPFSKEPGARLYRTGDLARYLPDGKIEFLGRTDHQVKLRGYRIELGEVECVLGQHVAVREAVVLVREDNPGDKRLVAYVVPTRESVPTISELRSFIKEKLPDYMVPSAFVFLDTVPLTANGKVDRKALPAPDQNRSKPEESFVAPRTPVEELLAAIWADVLKQQKVGVQDNFFDLGGHSLLATQVVSRIRDAFQMDIPLRTLFEKPTVEELAIAIMHHSCEQISEKELSGILNDLESLSKDELKQRLV